MMFRYIEVVSLLLICGAPLAAVDTPDFPISQDYSHTEQSSPAIAVGLDGDFAIVWIDYATGQPDVYVRTFDSGGVALGDPFIVNDDSTSAWQLDPDLSADWYGRFYAVWQDFRAKGYPFGPDIYFQRLDSLGAIGQNKNITVELPDSSRLSPAVAASGKGLSVAAWADLRNRNWDIFSQTLDSTGAFSGVNRRVNDDISTTPQHEPDVAISPDGWYIVVWYDSRSGNENIYLQRFDSIGNPVGINIKVNDDIGTAKQKFPVVAVSGNGLIYVVWADWRSGIYPQNPDIIAQRFSADLVRLGANFMVNSSISGVQRNPKVAADRMGNACVVWSDSSGGDWQALGQMIDNTGRFQGVNFALSSTSGGDQLFPDVAMDGFDLYFTWVDDRNGDLDIYGRIQKYNEPSLMAIPLNLHFTKDFREPDSAGQALIINNVGYGELGFRLTPSESWISISGERGATPDTVLVTTSSTAMARGEHIGYITLVDTINHDSSAVVPVTLSITGPVLEIAPDSLTFTALVELGSPSTQSLIITNLGTGILDWQASGSASWMQLDRVAGSAGDIIHVGCDLTGLAAGSHSGHIEVTCADAENSPESISVSLDLFSEIPFVEAVPAVIRDTLVLPDSLIGAVVIINIGGGVSSWTASTTALGITLLTGSGGDGDSLSYHISSSAMGVGDHVDTILLIDSVAFNSPAIILCSLTVLPRDTLTLVPAVIETGDSGRQEIYLRTHNPIVAGRVRLEAEASVIVIDSIVRDEMTPISGRISFSLDTALNDLTITIVSDSTGAALESGSWHLGDICLTSVNTMVGVTALQADTAIDATYLQLSGGYSYRPQILLGEIEISSTTGVEENRGQGILPFMLGQNKPNPFNSSTVILYSLDKPGRACLEIYNIVGQIVVTLVDRYHMPGQYQATWKGANGDGREMPSGVYFYRLSTPEQRAVKKLLLMK